MAKRISALWRLLFAAALVGCSQMPAENAAETPPALGDNVGATEAIPAEMQPTDTNLVPQPQPEVVKKRRAKRMKKAEDVVVASSAPVEAPPVLPPEPERLMPPPAMEPERAPMEAGNGMGSFIAEHWLAFFILFGSAGVVTYVVIARRREKEQQRYG